MALTAWLYGASGEFKIIVLTSAFGHLPELVIFAEAQIPAIFMIFDLEPNTTVPVTTRTNFDARLV
jgi:hypothetical protein